MPAPSNVQPKKAQPKLNSPTLIVLVALSCEAKPLIDFYRLRKQSSGAFPHFCRPAKNDGGYAINLVVTGIGTINMAAACGWIGARTSKHPSAWLNLGTAGHATLEVGEIVQVQRSMQLHAKRAHYPPRVAQWQGVGVSLLSYSAPCTEYPAEQAVDMEASALFATAKRFTSAELVQSLKVISDNQENGIENLNSALISELIAAQVSQINAFSEALIELIPREVSRDDPLHLIASLHCTQSQRQQYIDLFGKLENIGLSRARLSSLVDSVDSMRAVLRELRELQQAIPPTLLSNTGADGDIDSNKAANGVLASPTQQVSQQ
jgi:adenosylhomocysteine nucleosidase